MMAIFDKYTRLRKAMGPGSLYTERERMLDFLEGPVTRKQLPVLVAEPATVAGVQTCLQFAGDKKLPIEICSGLSLKPAADLGGKMLLSTAQLVSPPLFLDQNTRLQIAAGVSLEVLQSDLRQHEVWWPPLFPVPKNTSIGALIAVGWQGIRTWRHGGLLSHLTEIEWVDGSGNLQREGFAEDNSSSVDALPFLFGSRGELGVLTKVEFLLEPKPLQRAACSILLSKAEDVITILSKIGLASPPPEIVLLLDIGALEILRRGSGPLTKEQAKAAVICEWNSSIPEMLPSDFQINFFNTDDEVDELWKEVFALEPLAIQLFPARIEGLVVLPARAFANFETYARGLSHEANIPVALWGTVEVGYLHIWLLLPDDEPRLRRRADEVLEKLQDYAAQLGGGPAGKAAAGVLRRRALHRGSSATGWKIRAKLKEQLDPLNILPREKTL